MVVVVLSILTVMIVIMHQQHPGDAAGGGPGGASQGQGHAHQGPSCIQASAGCLDQYSFRETCVSDKYSFRLAAGGTCGLAGVPWRGSVSARLAWGDILSFSMLSEVLNKC